MHLPKNGRKLKHAAVKTSPKYGGVTSKLPCTLSLCPLGIILIRTKITMGKKKKETVALFTSLRRFSEEDHNSQLAKEVKAVSLKTGCSMYEETAKGV